MIGKNVVSDKGKEKIKSPGGAFIEVPNDVLEVMGNPLENKNSDKLKESNEDEKRQKAEEFAKNIPFLVWWTCKASGYFIRWNSFSYMV